MYSVAQQSLSRTRPVIPYNHSKLAAPPGMVYIPGGSTVIKYSQSSTDTNSKKKVSLSSFFIDKTEVTNQQYRQFVNWVLDSVAVSTYLKDDKYFLENKSGDSTKKRINWAKVNHKKIFESRDEDIKSKLQPMYENGEIKKEMYTFAYTYLKAVGTNTKAKVGEYTTEPVNVYPDEKIWAKDLANSQTDVLVENYFTAPPYDDYPVVGVNWKQARAFAYWRSKTGGGYANIADYMKYYHLTYTLPSEAQWVYAAQETVNDNKADETDNNAPEVSTSDSTANAPRDSASMAAAAMNPVIDSTPVDQDKHGLLANFKQDEGDYTEDGSAFTLPVMSYAPNRFGVYNMVGNVSEWVLDAYSPSAYAFVSDVNPVLLYDADSTDADAMKRKVVRGGSFMSNAKSLSPYYRDLELQNVSHCYIGFRCVMQAPEILTKKVATRKKRRA
jgi:formylglycine-generating enzyme required for sulfatase activity